VAKVGRDGRKDDVSDDSNARQRQEQLEGGMAGGEHVLELAARVEPTPVGQDQVEARLESRFDETRSNGSQSGRRGGRQDHRSQDHDRVLDRGLPVAMHDLERASKAAQSEGADRIEHRVAQRGQGGERRQARDDSAGVPGPCKRALLSGFAPSLGCRLLRLLKVAGHGLTLDEVDENALDSRADVRELLDDGRAHVREREHQDRAPADQRYGEADREDLHGRRGTRDECERDLRHQEHRDDRHGQPCSRKNGRAGRFE
jgi:hypothetical protein